WFGVGIWLETRDWFQSAAYRWLDPWTLQAEGVAISMLSLGWIALRWASARGAVAAGIATVQPTGRSRWLKTAVALVGSERPAVDRIVLRLVLVVLVGLGIYAAWPGVAQELEPRSDEAQAIASVGAGARFEILGIPHLHAAGWGSWLLLAAVA